MEQVEHPNHYNGCPIEVWDILDMYFKKDPLLWNAGKHLMRAGKKGDLIQDLEKAIQYIKRRIEAEKGNLPRLYSCQPASIEEMQKYVEQKMKEDTK